MNQHKKRQVYTTPLLEQYQWSISTGISLPVSTNILPDDIIEESQKLIGEAQ